MRPAFPSIPGPVSHRGSCEGHAASPASVPSVGRPGKLPRALFFLPPLLLVVTAEEGPPYALSTTTLCRLLRCPIFPGTYFSEMCSESEYEESSLPVSCPLFLLEKKQPPKTI